jgi:hypothetical protein
VARSHRSLLVIELKTDIVDVQEMLGTIDRKRRLARRIARERGWLASSASAWLIVADTRTNRRRAVAHREVLRSALSSDGRKVDRWLTKPVGAIAAVSFLPILHAAMPKRGSRRPRLAS